MKKIIRLTESDLTRIIKRVIAEGHAGNGNVLWVIDEQEIVDGNFYEVVEKLIKQNILKGTWSMKVNSQGTCSIDISVNGRKIFSDPSFGPISDIEPSFGNLRQGNFVIKYSKAVGPESNKLEIYNIEIQLLK